MEVEQQQDLHAATELHNNIPEQITRTIETHVDTSLIGT